MVHSIFQRVNPHCKRFLYYRVFPVWFFQLVCDFFPPNKQYPLDWVHSFPFLQVLEEATNIKIPQIILLIGSLISGGGFQYHTGGFQYHPSCIEHYFQKVVHLLPCIVVGLHVIEVEKTPCNHPYFKIKICQDQGTTKCCFIEERVPCGDIQLRSKCRMNQITKITTSK